MLPEEPAAFVAEVDVHGVDALYSPEAVLELDGLHRGAAEIRRAWEGWGKEIDSRTLVSASGDTIVDEWEGGGFKGIEYWRFNDDGLVYEHRVYGHPDVEPPPGLRERLRIALAHPAAAVALLRQRKR
jgi:hypothetical protein